MATWTKKQWGALIGAILVILGVTLGVGITIIIVVLGAIGYFIGSYLDGEFNLDDVRDRAQGRRGR